MVTKDLLDKMNFTHGRGNDSRRIRIFTFPDGIQIGFAGLGEGEERLTFPAFWDVKECLDCHSLQWVRFSTPQELQATPAGFVPQWWQFLEDHLIPRSLIYSNSSVAEPGQPLGLHGSEVTAVSTAAAHEQWEDKSCVSVEDIPTPPTPP